MAVVIALMGILMTFGIKLATSYQNKGAFSTTVDRQREIKDVLTAYLGQNGRLPCPADPTNLGTVSAGNEDQDPSSTICNKTRGLVPFQTLGMSRSSVVDGWDRYFTYSVWDNTNETACGAVPPFDEVPNDKRQNWTDNQRFPPPPDDYTETYHDGGDGCIKLDDNEIGKRAVAVIVSHGPNGFGGYNSKGVQVDGATDKERANTTLSTDPELFYSRPMIIGGFDDIVMGITANDLLIPLKKSGTIVSINELERQYLYAAFKVAFTVDPSACQLTYTSGGADENVIFTIPGSDTLLGGDIDLATTGSVQATYSGSDTSIIISSSRYCPGYISTPTEPPP